MKTKLLAGASLLLAGLLALAAYATSARADQGMGIFGGDPSAAAKVR